VEPWKHAADPLHRDFERIGGDLGKYGLEPLPTAMSHIDVNEPSFSSTSRALSLGPAAPPSTKQPSASP